MKKGLLLTMFCVSMLAGCKKPITTSMSSHNSASMIPSKTETGSLEGLYHTKSINGTIKLENDNKKAGVYFYCDDTMYKGYHSLTDVKVYKNGEIQDISKLKDGTSAIAEFITGLGKEDGSLDLSVGDLYKVTILA